VRKLAVCLALVAVLSLTCAVFAQCSASKCTGCTKAGLCDTHKAAVAACADCKTKGICDKEQKAVDACAKCKKDCKCEKCKK